MQSWTKHLKDFFLFPFATTEMEIGCGHQRMNLLVDSRDARRFKTENVRKLGHLIKFPKCLELQASAHLANQYENFDHCARRLSKFNF